LRRALTLSVCLLAAASLAWCGEEGKTLFVWPGFEESEAKPLPDLPDPLGVAGPFAGVHEDALIVAGGAHFAVSPFQGGKKLWLNRVYVLEEAGGAYRWYAPELTLEGPLAYGASISTDEGVVCIGGQDGERCYADVFRLRWDPETKQVLREELPALPQPCANHAAAKIGSVVYVAGGQSSPDATAALRTFWSLDLAAPVPEQAWVELPWPEDAPGRILPMAAAQSNGKGDAFYLFGGAELIQRPDGTTTRRFLKDAWAYGPTATEPKPHWQRVADLPTPLAAGTATDYGPYHVLLFGGDDGALFEKAPELGDEHPGFPQTIYAYHAITDTWIAAGEMPAGHVTTTAVKWDGAIVIPSGEDRPGHRSPKILRAVPKPREARFGAVNMAVLVGYLVVLVIMGIYFSKREKSTEDFFLAGRRVPWWAAGLSIYGTQLSAITFIAIPAAVFALNWVPLMANFTIFLIAPVIVFFYLPFFRRLNVTTAYEYLEKRFNIVVRLWGSVTFVFYQIGRMGIVLLLPAIALSAATGINLYLSIAVMGVLCTIYTVLGGIEAVIWTDVLQVVVLLGGAILSLFIIAGNVDGGLAGVIEMAAEDGKFHMFNWTWDYTIMAAWVVLIGNLFGNLVPYTTDQAVVQRYLTTQDETRAARSIWTNAILVIPGSLTFFTIGAALFVFFKTQPQLLEPGLQADAIFPLFIVEKLPVGVAGLVIAGVFAASMSSLDSSLNSVATALVTDFYRRFKTDAEDHRCLNLARGITVVLGLAATAAALYMGSFGGDIKSLWFLFVQILGLLGGALAGIFALAIFSRRTSGVGAIAGAAAGIAATLFVWRTDLMHFYLWAVVGVVVTFVVGYAVSLVVPERKNLAGLTIYTLRDGGQAAAGHEQG
jgi:SSS family transporter